MSFNMPITQLLNRLLLLTTSLYILCPMSYTTEKSALHFFVTIQYTGLPATQESTKRCLYKQEL
jgi:hypothetical protein